MLQNGAVVAGKYKILQKIGSGGMSTVYLAEDLNLNKKWTVKEIIKSGQEKKDQLNLDSLIAEANLIKKIDHPAIPRIVDIIDTKSTVFIVRDFIDGEPMHQVIRIYGAQPENAVVEWAKQLCDVLDYLHHMTPKVIYRDMKPSNIMLMPDGSLRLIDFGIAQEVGKDDDDRRMRTGTKGYAPAEQMRADRKTDERSDIYALGMTLYQIATGISPTSAGFDRNKPACEQNPRISARLSKIIEKCIQENPDDRFQNCAELRYALGKLSGRDVSETRGENPVLKKIAGTVCLILFFLFVALGLLSAPGDAGGLLHWAIDGILNCKNVYFLCGILLLLVYMLLRGRDTPQGEQSAAEGLKGSNNSIVISNAQEGSMMDLLRSGDASGVFGRSMDTSEAVHYGAFGASGDPRGRRTEDRSVSMRPISLLDGSASSRQPRQSVRPSEDPSDPIRSEDLREQDTETCQAVDSGQDTDTIPDDDLSEPLDVLQIDPAPSAGVKPPEEMTQLLESFEDESTACLDETQPADATQLPDPLAGEEVTAPFDETQPADATQLPDPLAEEEITAPFDETQPADATQLLDPLAEEEITAPFDETQFFDDPDAQQALDSPEPDGDPASEPFRILRREIVVHTDETIA